MQLSFESFRDQLKSENDCIGLLFQAKWPAGFRCPRCSHSAYSEISTRRLPLFECLHCGKQTSLISDTIFRHSRTPLRSWFLAIYLHARPESINALQLSQTIGVTYKTAWLMCHKLRYAMSQSDAETLLSGIVRISDAILYRRIVPPNNFMDFEQPVFAGSMEDEDGELTHVKIRISPRSLRKDRHSSPDASDFVKQVVAPEAIPYAIVTKRHGKARNPELVWLCRSAERWMARKFRGIGLKHLQVYLDHYCYMENRFERPIYEELLHDCVRRRGIDYPTLTGLRERSLRPSRQKQVAASFSAV